MRFTIGKTCDPSDLEFAVTENAKFSASPRDQEVTAVISSWGISTTNLILAPDSLELFRIGT